MNYESFFSAIKEDGLELTFERTSRRPSPSRLSNEALFHLPLLAITILVISQGRRKPPVNQIGQLVGECFERVFVGFKGSSQHLGWSANLRMRTVRALSFLEAAFLVTIIRDRTSATPIGRTLARQVLDDEESDLSYTLHLIIRAYRDIHAERQLSLEL